MARFAFVVATLLALAGVASAVGGFVMTRGVPDETQAIGAGLSLLLGALVFAILFRGGGREGGNGAPRP